MNQELGGYTFLYDPPQGLSGNISLQKSRAELKTLTGQVVFNWGFKDWKDLVLRWPFLPKSQWDSIYALWIADDGADTYTYDPQTGTTYTVEIMDMEGTPFGDPANYDWLVDVVIALKILSSS